MRKHFFLLLGYIFFAIWGCSTSKEKIDFDPAGKYRATLLVQGQTLGFNFDLRQEQSGWLMVLENAEERIDVPQVKIFGDSLVAEMHIFDCTIAAVWKNGRWDGVWRKNYLPEYEVAFSAFQHDTNRFSAPVLPPQINLDGRWEVTFFEPDDTLQAVGIFIQEGAKLSGTFLTPLGDYRYLEGQINGGQFVLSAFDGEHAFLFGGSISGDGSIKGDFWSGKHFYASWHGVRNDTASLPDANTLTFLKPEYERLDFSFPDLQGKMVSLSDAEFQGKVVVLQLFGTWCPNCMDETRFLADWYSKNQHPDLRILGLAYERKDDFEYAKSRIEKVVDRFDVAYSFLVAGTSDKEEAAKTLPALNKILAFPTTIFIDKKGDVRKIHTGFSGPGTGKYYEMFVEEFNSTVRQLLAE